MSAVPFNASSPPSNTNVIIPPAAATPAPATFPFLSVQYVDGGAETVIIFPANTVRFIIRMKDPSNQSSMRLAVVSSETFSQNFLLLRPTSSFSEVDLLLTQDLYIYLRSDFKPFDVEVLYWTT
jgi:hypothetical protein